MPPKKRQSARAAAGGDAPASKKVKSGEEEIHGRSVRWELENDAGKWQQFAAEHSLALTQALEKKKSQISIEVAPKVTMVMQVNNMVQKNKKTGFERRLRMVIRDPKDGEFYIWQWEDEKGKWSPYSAALCLQLEDAQERATATVDFEACHRSYSVNLSEMKQINTDTDVKREVLRSKSDAAGPGDAAETVDVSRADIKIEEEEEEDVPQKRKGRGSAKASAKSGRGKKGEENRDTETKI